MPTEFAPSTIYKLFIANPGLRDEIVSQSEKIWEPFKDGDGKLAREEGMKVSHSVAEQVLATVNTVAPERQWESYREWPVNQLRHLAYGVAISMAMQRRAKDRCIHINMLDLAQPKWVWLSRGAIVCRQCLGHLISEIESTKTPDDSRCDVCEKPSKNFHEFYCQAGTLSVQGNYCPECVAFVRVMEKERAG